MERKFHDRFYNGHNEAKLSDLASVRQGQDEPASDYFRRFKDIKNRCFNLTVSEKELADLAFDGLRSYLKKELEGFEYHTVNYLHMKVLGLEFRLQNAKDAHNTNRSIHVDCKSDSDDEKKEFAQFIWPSEAKPCSCSSLKPIPKNRQEQVRFTFDVSKCDRIFDELLRSGNIKLSHVIPPLEELKRHAYCKWHNIFSHATNDCNIFRRKIQSAVNEGRLAMHEVKDDNA